MDGKYKRNLMMAIMMNSRWLVSHSTRLPREIHMLRTPILLLQICPIFSRALTDPELYPPTMRISQNHLAWVVALSWVSRSASPAIRYFSSADPSLHRSLLRLFLWNIPFIPSTPASALLVLLGPASLVWLQCQLAVFETHAYLAP